MEPIFANCNKCSGRASTFAPQSINSEIPVSVGMIGASGGRLIPRIRPTIVCPPTRTAPELPAETNAPAEIVKGAVDAVSSREDIKVFLVGQEDVVREELQKYPYPQERIEVVDAPEVIEMAEPPVQAIR